MVQKVYKKAKSLLWREKFDEKVALRELEIALKLVEEATSYIGEKGGFWFFGRWLVRPRLQSAQDRKSKLQQARKLILDARKHDEKLLALGKELLDSLGPLPIRLKQQIILSEETKLFVGESIALQLKLIAQEVSVIELNVVSDPYGGGSHIDDRAKSSVKKVKDDLDRLVRRIKDVFSVHANVAKSLEMTKNY